MHIYMYVCIYMYCTIVGLLKGAPNSFCHVCNICHHTCCTSRKVDVLWVQKDAAHARHKPRPYLSRFLLLLLLLSGASCLSSFGS